MISAKVIADSVNTTGDRITTFVLEYPRFILAEVNTHKMLSKNGASSRAIPAAKIIERVLANPAAPVHWGKNQKGMKADEELGLTEKLEACRVWHEAMESAVAHARKLIDIGVHKQVVNRILEPFSHTTTLITGTEWGNFFNLRVSKDAQPEFRLLAYRMLEVYDRSIPELKYPGEWHIPFGDQYTAEDLTTEQKLKIATARAARVSYLTFEGNIDHEKDYQLADQLVKEGHMSPTEHSACALGGSVMNANYRGWQAYRKYFSNENKQAFDVKKLLEEGKSWNENTI